MKKIRIVIVLLFLITAGAYGGLRVYHEMTVDTTCPEIVCASDTLKISVEDAEEKLLEGVTASDDRDGDLTGEITVENITPFLSDGSRRITYVVCDNANNTSRIERTLFYKDYKPPRFNIEQNLRFPAGEKLDILSYLTAEDVLDGNITNKILCTHGDLYEIPSIGFYELSYQVANSAGDIAELEVNVEIYNPEEANFIPEIHLSDYILYIKKGKLLNPYQYLEDVTIGGRVYEISTGSEEKSAVKGAKIAGLYGNLSNQEPGSETVETLFYNDIAIESSVDTEKVGSYKVEYTAVTADGYVGTATLSVQVYE